MRNNNMFTQCSRFFRVGAMALALAVGYVSSSFGGPISELYLTTGNSIYVVQGNSVVRSFATPAGGEFPIAVNGQVRTTGYSAAVGGGREYTLTGTPTGPTYSYPGGGMGSGYFYDGTTDGTFNYAAHWSGGDIYRMNTDWTNPTLLFNAGGNELTITYDPTDSTLWIKDFSGGQMQHYTLGGSLLDSFMVSQSSLTALALDHADGTLWMAHHASDGYLYNYAKDGAYLGASAISGLPINVSMLGGEFDLDYTPAPEPGTFLLLALGLSGLRFARQRRLNA